jgi:hypothetical protein
MMDWATEDYFQEDQQMREDPRSTRSVVSVNPTIRKISIGKANKI